MINIHTDNNGNRLDIKVGKAKALLMVKPFGYSYYISEFVFSKEKLTELIDSLKDARDSL